MPFLVTFNLSHASSEQTPETSIFVPLYPTLCNILFYFYLIVSKSIYVGYLNSFVKHYKLTYT